MALRGGQISALAKLISDASKVVEAHFAKSSKPYVPSLDDTEPHPIDKQLAGKELRTAVQTIEGACAQLSATVARPSHTIINVCWRNLLFFTLSNRFFFQKLMGVCDKFPSNLCNDWPISKTFETNCLNVALTFKIPDVLKEKPAGMHVSEIGKKTGLEERKAGRILRLLSTNHVFREGPLLHLGLHSPLMCILVSENVFTNNRLSTQLLSANPLSSIGLHL